jgi:hypothetical protein
MTLLTRQFLRYLSAADTVAAKLPTQEDPVSTVSLLGKRNTMTTSQTVTNNRLYLFVVNLEALLQDSEDAAANETVIIG